MTTKSRRQRSDSTDNLHRIMAGANMELGPPCHVPLNEQDWGFWHSIVQEFAKSDWTRHQLEMAALLARTMGQLEAQQRTLFKEGMVFERVDGSVYFNPRIRVVDGLASKMLAIRRSLGLTGRAKAGSTRDVARLREANRLTEQATAGGDDLLA